MQMGAEIRQSVADVDTDSLLSQNWPPSRDGHGIPKCSSFPSVGFFYSAGSVLSVSVFFFKW